MSLNINLFTSVARSTETPAVSASEVSGSPQTAPRTVACPHCIADITPVETPDGWQTCPFCDKRLQIRVWPVLRQSTNAVSAVAEQATCFFHPENAFQACCQRCGRFVCALCDLQLGAEHVCPTCFERGRTDTWSNGGKAEWRHRDVLYDSIAVTIGWGWILVWPLFIAAIPAAIVLHVKYRKAPRSYLIPRSGWRFWMAYPGLGWLPLVIAIAVYVRWIAGRN